MLPQAKLDGLVATAEWSEHMTRATPHLEGSGTVRGVREDQAHARMEIWRKRTPT